MKCENFFRLFSEYLKTLFEKITNKIFSMCKILKTLFEKVINKIFSTCKILKNKYVVLFQLMSAMLSIVGVYFLYIMSIIVMDKSVKFFLQVRIINLEEASIGGVTFILIIPVIIILFIFNKRFNGELFLRKYILNNAEYYKCSFNIIFFIVGLILLQNQYWPISDVSKIFFQNKSFWGIPLMVLFSRVVLDYYLLEEKELNNKR